MKRVIEVKHVGPREQVRELISELIDRVEEKLTHHRSESLSTHVVFEENGSHKLYRASVSLHIPGHMLAAHDEGANAGAVIRSAFKEITRQLEKRNALLRGEHLRKRAARARREPLAVEPTEVVEET